MSSTVSVVVPRQNLTGQDWAEAALDAIASGGIEAVAVEPLARKLGVTKGSFYWHYPNRDALVARALEVWEHHETVEMIGHAEQEPHPRERLHTLFRTAANTDQRSERILLALSGSRHEPARACVRRVAEAWRAYIEGCYRGLGLDVAAAQHWATFAYSTYIGTVRMRRDNPDVLPPGPAFNDYLRFLIRTLIPAESASTAGVAPHGSVIPLRKAG